MAEVDSLSIKVAVDTGASVVKLKGVTDAIKNLNSAAASKNISNLQKSLSGLSSATKGLSGLGRAVKSIEKINVSPKLKENLDKIADAADRLSKAGRGVKSFADGLKGISSLGADVDLDKKFAAVAQSVGQFATAVNNSVSEDTLKRLERLADVLDRISKSSKVPNIKAPGGSRGGGSAVNTAIKWQSVVKAVETVNKTSSEIGQGLYGVIDASGVIKDLDRMSGAISKNIPILGELTSAWKHEAAEVKNIVLSQASIVDKAADLMLVRVKRLTKLLYSFAKLPFSPASMKVAAGAIGLVIAPLKRFADNVSDLKSRWDRFTASISRIAVYRLIRTALKELAQGIKEGVDNLYQWGLAWQGVYSSADRFVSSMNQLATAFLYLKNSVGAAVSPLIDYVAPIIDRLIDKFVALTNAINQAIAALSGAGIWRKALKYPTAYAEAAGGAAKKVKELERTVLAFDELNKLNDNKDNPRSGAAEALDYSKMFEESPVDSALAALVNAPSWRGLGNIVANKINEALESINWVKIQGTVRKWAKRFGSLFDEILIELNMPLVGQTIGEGLNTIAIAINTFFDEFHWRTIGQHLSDGFESLIDTLNWADIGRSLTQKWKAAFELVIGFKDVDLSGLGNNIVTLFKSAIDNIPISEFVDALAELMPKIGKELGIAINGIITKSNEVISGIDAEGFGSAFGTTIDNMLASIDPKQAGIFLTNGLKKIIEFATGALKTLPWEDLNTSLAEMITAAFKNIDLKQGVQNAIDLAAKIVEFLTTAVNSIPWEDVGRAIESADTSKLKEGLKGLLESVVDGLERAGVLDEVAGGAAAYMGLKLSSALAKMLPSMLTLGAASKAATGAAAGGSGAAAAGGALGGGLLSALGLGAVGAGTGAALGQQLSHHVLGPILEGFGAADAELYKNWTFFGEGGLFQASLDFSKMKGEEFEGFLEGFGESHKKLWDSVSSGDWEGFITSIGDAWETEHPLITAGIDAVKEHFNNMSLSISKNVDTISEKMGHLSAKIKGSLGEINQSFSSMKGFSLDVDLKGKADPGKITKRASGGVVDKGDLFLAGEAGPEIVTSFGGDTAVMNMEQIISAISASVATASGGNITIPISLDGGLLDTIIVTAQQRQSLRSGT